MAEENKELEEFTKERGEATNVAISNIANTYNSYISLATARFIADKMGKKAIYENEDEINVVNECLVGLTSKFDLWEAEDYARAFTLIMNLEATQYGIESDIQLDHTFTDQDKKDGRAHISLGLDYILSSENKAEAFVKEVIRGAKIVEYTELDRAAENDVTVEALKLMKDYYARLADEKILHENDRTVDTSAFEISSADRAFDFLGNIFNDNHKWPEDVKNCFEDSKNNYENNKPKHLRARQKDFDSSSYQAARIKLGKKKSAVMRAIFNKGMEKDFDELEKVAKRGPEGAELVKYVLKDNIYYEILAAAFKQDEEKLKRFFKDKEALTLKVLRHIDFKLLMLRLSCNKGKKALEENEEKIIKYERARDCLNGVIDVMRDEPAGPNRYNTYISENPKGKTGVSAAITISYWASLGTAAAKEYMKYQYGILNASSKATAEKVQRSLEKLGINVVLEPANTCLDHPTLKYAERKER